MSGGNWKEFQREMGVCLPELCLLSLLFALKGGIASGKCMLLVPCQSSHLIPHYTFGITDGIRNR